MRFDLFFCPSPSNENAISFIVIFVVKCGCNATIEEELRSNDAMKSEIYSELNA